MHEVQFLGWPEQVLHDGSQKKHLPVESNCAGDMQVLQSGKPVVPWTQVAQASGHLAQNAWLSIKNPVWHVVHLVVVVQLAQPVGHWE